MVSQVGGTLSTAPSTQIVECAWTFAGSNTRTPQGLLFSVNANGWGTLSTVPFRKRGYAHQSCLMTFSTASAVPYSLSAQTQRTGAVSGENTPECYVHLERDNPVETIVVFGSKYPDLSGPQSGSGSGVLPAGFYRITVVCDAGPYYYASDGGIQASAIPYCIFTAGQPVGPFATGRPVRWAVPRRPLRPMTMAMA